MWPDGSIVFTIFGRLQQWKFAQQCKKIAKLESTFCQMPNKPSKDYEKLSKFCQMGEISLNQDTLAMI